MTVELLGRQVEQNEGFQAIKNPKKPGSCIPKSVGQGLGSVVVQSLAKVVVEQVLDSGSNRIELVSGLDKSSLK